MRRPRRVIRRMFPRRFEVPAYLVDARNRRVVRNVFRRNGFRAVFV